jgi:hypothetical protein
MKIFQVWGIEGELTREINKNIQKGACKKGKYLL